jgi:hypothetical protein
MGSIKIWNGTSWVDEKALKVYNDQIVPGYTTAKGVWVYDGLAWKKVWPETSTVFITGPTQVLSNDSGTGGPMRYIAPARFTITLSNYAAVSKVELQFWDGTNGWAATWQTWTNPTSNTLVSNGADFAARGTRYARAIVTLTDTPQSPVYSSNHAFTVSKKTLTVSPTTTTPTTGTDMLIYAGCGDDCPAWQTSSGWYYTTQGSAWILYASGVNPMTWVNPQAAGQLYWWTYRENFADGSYISAPYTSITPTAPVPTERVVNGGTHTSIQNALDASYYDGLPVRLTGSFDCSGRIYMPANVSVNATGAVLNSYHSGQMVVNKGPGNSNTATGGGYTHAGGWLWDGGSFDARNNSSTAFSLSHCPSATIQNITVWNTKATGHGIEVNSSGGNPVTSTACVNMTDAQFTIKIINATFLGMDTVPRSSDYDEAMHIDYSWIRYFADGSYDLAATNNVANDGTVCNNVLWLNCTVKRTRNYSYPVGFGSHHGVDPYGSDAGGKRAGPVAPHRNIKVKNCTFENVVPQNFAANLRGACHIRNSMRHVVIEGCTFTSCYNGVTFQRVNVDDVYSNTLITDLYVQNNHFISISGAYPWIYTDGTANDKWWGVYTTGNLFSGSINGGLSAYLLRLENTDNWQVVSNYFWGLSGNAALAAQGGNRIYGTPSAPGSGNTNMVLSNNTWSSSANGAGAVVSNS